MTSIINAYAIVDFVTGHLPALSSGFIGGLLAEPVKAWFIEPLKAKALARQRTRTMRTDLYRGLARDMALLKRVEEMSELTEWPTHLRQIGGEQQESTPRTALEHWLNGRLLEDLSTETFDDWRKTYPTEYLLLPEADAIRDFYKRLKQAVEFQADSASFDQKLEKYLYAYSWLLGHVRQGLLDNTLLVAQTEKIEEIFARRSIEMRRDIIRTR